MTGGPLTILQLTHQGGPAGSTQSIFNLSQYLNGRGHRVLVGCRDDVLLARLARDAGLPVVPLAFLSRGALTRAVADLLARERVDVVNSHATLDRRALTWMRWRGRLPGALVVTRRTMPRTSPVELLPVGLTADRTIAVSEAVARALRRRLHPGARLRVVPNGIALERIDAAVPAGDLAAARAALGDTDGRPVVAIVSRLKDQHVVLQALPRLARGVVVACVGVEPDARLRALAEAAPSRHRVVFVPLIDRPLAFYRLAALAALPSRMEGLSQSLLEAMALGLPVAASAAGGNPDLVHGGETGLLIPPLDPAAWAAGLERLLGEDAQFGGAVDRLPVSRRRTKSLPGLLLWSRRAASLARQRAVRFVYCGNVKPAGYPARWVYERTKTPYCVFLYGADLLSERHKYHHSRLKRRASRAILGGAAALVAISNWTRDLALTVLGELGLDGHGQRLRVVHLGTDPARFRPRVDGTELSRRLELADGSGAGLGSTRWLLTVARLEPHKGIDTVLQALPAILARAPDVRYAVAGAGAAAERAKLERLASELGVAERVQFLGEVSERDLPALYGLATVYVGASRRGERIGVEGFGISLVEASACGLPVVAGNSGGVPDAVRDGETGFLVPPEDPAAFCDAICRLLADDELARRVGAAGRRAVETYYNWDRVVRDLRAVEAEVVAR